MAKNPAFQFYPGDWARDLEEHSLEIEGAWIRICCKLWWSETRGSHTKTLRQWGRILRVEIEHASEILTYIKNEKIGEISGNLTEPNGDITVKCRRMLRDEKDRESNRLRQKRFYEKQRPNGKPNKKLTVPSSVLLSSSSTSKNKTYTVSFENFWKKYPNHQGSKAKAFKAWKKAKLDKSLIETIMASLKEHKEKSSDWVRGFIPHAATWLNGENWTAEFEEDRESTDKPVIIEGSDGQPMTYEEYMKEK